MQHEGLCNRVGLSEDQRPTSDPTVDRRRSRCHRRARQGCERRSLPPCKSAVVLARCTCVFSSRKTHKYTSPGKGPAIICWFWVFLSKYWKMDFSIFDVYLSKTCSMLFHHLLKSTLEAKNRPWSAQELLFADCYALGNPFWCNCCGAFWKLENMDFDNPCMAFESFQPPTALHVSKMFRW